MNPRLIVSLIAVVILAVVGLLLFGNNGETVPIGPVGVGEEEIAEEETPEDQDAGMKAEDASAESSRTSVVSAPAKRDLDPRIRAALTGFRGRLVTEDATPVPDAKVELFRFAQDSVLSQGVTPMLGQARGALDVDAGETESGDDGKFEITGVWPHGFYLVRAGHGSDAPALHIVDQIPGPGEIVDLGDIVIRPSGILTGIVVDEEGEPIPGALVRAADIPGALLSMAPVEQFDPEGGLIIAENGRTLIATCPGWVKERFDMLPIPTTYAGEDGSFRLTGVIPGANVFAITKRGHLPHVKQRLTIKSGQEKDLGEISMRDGEALMGRVIDTEGKPIPDAEILAAPVGAIPVHFARFAPNTNAKGEFELNGFPNQNVIVAARRTAGDPWTVAESQPITRDIEIQLQATYDLVVSVESEPGLAIQNPKFQLTPGKLGEGAIEMAMWGATSPVDVESRLEALEDNRWAIRDVPSGEFALLVHADGHAVGSESVKIDGDTETSVTLRADQSFEVTVLDPNGAPLKGCAFYVEARGKRPRIPEFPVHCGTTDEDGRLEVDSVAATQIRFTAYHPAYGNAHGNTNLPPQEPITLQMIEPGKITGTLMEKGQPPTPGKWSITIERKWSSGDRGALENMPRLVTPDLDGQFEITGLRPGEYRLRPMDSIAAITSPGKLMSLMQASWMRTSGTRKTVEVVSGGTATINLDTDPGQQQVDGPSGQILGTVIVDGAPARDMTIMTWANGQRRVAEVDAGGRFDLGQVKVGRANVQLYEIPKQGEFRPNRNSIWSDSVEVKENEIHDITIEISIGSMSGTVSGMDGSPQTARISANGQVRGGKGHVWFHTTADASGNFEFERIPAGEYQLEAETEEQKGRMSKVVVEPGLQRSGVQISMKQMLRVSGTLDTSAFGDQKPDWIWMRFTKVDAAGKPAGEQHWVGTHEGKWETTELSPGTWTVRINGPKAKDGFEWVHDSQVTVGSNDQEGVAIRPVEKPRK